MPAPSSNTPRRHVEVIARTTLALYPISSTHYDALILFHVHICLPEDLPNIIDSLHFYHHFALSAFFSSTTTVTRSFAFFH
jgi:hypothetical protein